MIKQRSVKSIVAHNIPNIYIKNINASLFSVVFQVLIRFELFDIFKFLKKLQFGRKIKNRKSLSFKGKSRLNHKLHLKVLNVYINHIYIYLCVRVCVNMCAYNLNRNNISIFWLWAKSIPITSLLEFKTLWETFVHPWGDLACELIFRSRSNKIVSLAQKTNGLLIFMNLMLYFPMLAIHKI